MSDAQIDRIAPLREAGVVSWRELPPGLCNRSFLVDTRRGRWVLRLNGEVPGVDRQAEAGIVQAVAEAGLGPPVIACDPRQGYLICEYLDGRCWDRGDFQRPQRQASLARRLRELHALPVAAPLLDVPALVGDYLSRTGLARNPALLAASDRLLLELRRDGYFEHRGALCHHDLHASNIIGGGQTAIRFVDFEFAGRGHPALDLGFIIQYHDLPVDEWSALVAAYYGSPAKDARVTVSLAVRLAQLLELLWLSARGQQVGLPERSARRLKRLLLAWG